MSQIPQRVEWVDYAKGFCIVLVVMMHSTYGVEAAMGEQGWTHVLAAFARPFRMPDFFLISGLFLARVIDRDWRSYLDKKLVHFAYFYLLWLAIQTLVKGLWFGYGAAGMSEMFLFSLIQPFGSMWFIYLLPIFFIFTKMMRNVSPILVFLLGAELEILDVATGWVLIDEFCGRLVYFFAGYWLATHIFALAAWVRAHKLAGLAGLIAWAVVNGGLVYAGWSDLPFISLGLGFAGAVAVVTLAALITGIGWLSLLRHAGQNSIVVYLAFFLPMAASRVFLIKTGFITDVGLITVIVTAMGVAAPLVLHAVLKRFDKGMFLFCLPNWAHLPPAPKPVNVPELARQGAPVE